MYVYGNLILGIGRVVAAVNSNIARLFEKLMESELE